MQHTHTQTHTHSSYTLTLAPTIIPLKAFHLEVAVVVFFFFLPLFAHPLEYFSAYLSALASKQVSPLPGALRSLVFLSVPFGEFPFSDTTPPR